MTLLVSALSFTLSKFLISKSEPNAPSQLKFRCLHRDGGDVLAVGISDDCFSQPFVQITKPWPRHFWDPCRRCAWCFGSWCLGKFFTFNIVRTSDDSALIVLFSETKNVISFNTDKVIVSFDRIASLHARYMRNPGNGFCTLLHVRISLKHIDNRAMFG